MTTTGTLGRLGTVRGQQSLWGVEQQELTTWQQLTQSSPPATGGNAADDDRRACRLPFNILGVNRLGRHQPLQATSQSVGVQRAVLHVRRPLALYETVVMQLDDGTDRPWVRAKVLENTQTVGGYYVLVEFLAWEQRAA